MVSNPRNPWPPWVPPALLGITLLAAPVWIRSASAAPGTPMSGTVEVWAEVPGVNPRSGAVAVFAGDRMILFGGGGNAPDYNDVWALPLTGPPEWIPVTTSGTPPPALREHSAIYDPIGDRVIVFGGLHGDPIGDVWSLALAPSPVWSHLTPAGAPPSPRAHHSAVYDPVRERMIVFGGVDGDGAVLDQVWTLSLSGAETWTLLAPGGTGPGPRANAAAVYDPIGDRMVVYGGATSGDLWALSLGDDPTWTQLAAGSPPSPRSASAAVYDPAGSRMILFGGVAGGTETNEVWALDLSGPPAWTMLSPAGDPPLPRTNAAGTYDVLAGRLIVFGGLVPGRAANDVWALTLGATPAWTEIHPSNATPGYRNSHSSIYDPVRGRMLTYGGDPAVAGEVWALALGPSLAWERLDIAGPAPGPAGGHSAIYDPLRDRMIVFGGAAGNNEVWALDLASAPAWGQLAPIHKPPAPRWHHSAIYDPVGDRMIVYGGEPASVSGELWELTLSGTPAWNPLAASGTPPPPRSRHAAIYDPVRHRMIVFAGCCPELGDVWELSLSGSPAWMRIVPSNGDRYPREWASAIYDPVRDRMVAFGGANFQWSNSYSEYLTLGDNPTWSAGPRLVTNEFGGRAGHTAIYDPAADRMVIFAGWGVAGLSFNLWDTWTLTWGTPVGVADAIAMGELRLSQPRPNPAQDHVTIDLDAGAARTARIDVLDISGRLVRTLFHGAVVPGSQVVRWDLRDAGGRRVRPGFYLATVRAEASLVARRLVVVE